MLGAALFHIDGWVGLALLWALPVLLTVCAATWLGRHLRGRNQGRTFEAPSPTHRRDTAVEPNDGEPTDDGRLSTAQPSVFGVFGSSRLAERDDPPDGANDELVAEIDQARETWTSGEISQGQLLLQQVIIAARQRKDMRTEARARIELAAISEAEGDATSACEHFQIARQLYLDAQAPNSAHRVEASMRKLGCPSGWVLEGF